MIRQKLLLTLTAAGFSLALAGLNVQAGEDSGDRMTKGALVGAGTNVIGGAALDTLDGSGQPQYMQVQGPDGQMYWQQVTSQEDPNKTILKRAVQGAITGAVAAEVAGGENGNNSGSSVEKIVNQATTRASSQTSDEDDDRDYGKKQKHKKSKEGHEDRRPPGWDRGKKTGWNGGDVPPGHQDRDDRDEDQNENSGNWFSRLFGGKD